MVSLSHAYAKLSLARDAHQLGALESLESLGRSLLKRPGKSCVSKTSRYLVGSVGSGKSLIMDLFVEQVNAARKDAAQRYHFAEFMSRVHHQLHQIKAMHPKQVDPFEKVAQIIVKKSPILCLDEFQLVDIADAMILRRLFENLFMYSRWYSQAPESFHENTAAQELESERMPFSLITTSNKPISQLYATGLNRALVLPLINLLETNCETLVLNSPVDYRTISKQSNEPTFYFPQREITSVSGESPNSKMLASMDLSTPKRVHEAFQSRFLKACGATANPHVFTISLVADRTLQVYGIPHTCINIPFSVLCGDEGRLSGADYVAICTHLTSTRQPPILPYSIFISGPVPLLDKNASVLLNGRETKCVDAGRRLINLVDVAYDFKVGVVVEACASLRDIFRGLMDEKNVENEKEFEGVVMETRVLKEGGASSSGSATYIGHVEWSATGLQNASLANIGGKRGNVGETETYFAVERAVSRLTEMGSEAWKRNFQKS